VGASLIEDRKLYFEASPVSYATYEKSLGPYVLGQRTRPAFLLAWGTADDVNPPSQSENFLLALKQSGFSPVDTVVLPGAAHFWMSDPIDEPASYTAFLAPRLVRFLQRSL
jgi:dipeptidyl aminopeptidase/acylaminoacyl peptidase